MELFSNRVLKTNSSISNYNSLLESFLTVFIVLSNDGWTLIYANHFRQSEPISTSIYFISLVIIGQFILMNLLIAIIIENFEYRSVKNDLVSKLNTLEKEQMEKNMTLKERFLAYFCNMYIKKDGKQKSTRKKEAEEEFEKMTDERYIEE